MSGETLGEDITCALSMKTDNTEYTLQSTEEVRTYRYLLKCRM